MRCSMLCAAAFRFPMVMSRRPPAWSVWAGQEPGREILYPVATVILGGLFTSTFCEFLIHPGLFWRYSGRDSEQWMRAEADVI